MSDPVDPTDGWAKAAEATANAAGKAIDAARNLGRFVAGPGREVVGMVEDRFKVARFERQIRLLERVNAMLEEKGLNGPTRQIPLNIGIPLLSQAVIEEDDELQDLWAALLVNAADRDSGFDIRRAFISMLSDMTAIDARVLALVAASPNGTARSVEVGPGTSVYVTHFSAKPSPPASNDIIISLLNLQRLGCVHLQLMVGGGLSYNDVSVTPLGAALIEACTEPKKQ